MKTVSALLLLMVFITACSYNKYQKDVSENRYDETDIYADSNATYIGEWTAQTDLGNRSVKIKKDGRLKVCLGSSEGTTEGKVFVKDGQPAIVMKTGAIVEILESTKDYLVLNIYGKKEKYYAGLFDSPCVTAFENF